MLRRMLVFLTASVMLLCLVTTVLAQDQPPLPPGGPPLGTVPGGPGMGGRGPGMPA